MNCFHTQFDGFFRPSRLVWEALPEQPGDGSELIGIDPEVLADAGVVDALPPDQAAEVQAATGAVTEGSEGKTAEKKEEKEKQETVSSMVMELVESGLITKSYCDHGYIQALLDDPHPPSALTPSLRQFLQEKLDAGDAGIHTLNLQLKEYFNTREAFKVSGMRKVVERSHENVYEQSLSWVKDTAGNGLKMLTTMREKYPLQTTLAGLAACAGLIYLIWKNPGKSFKAAAVIGGLAIAAPLLTEAVQSNIQDPESKSTSEKEAKTAFLTEHLPPSFRQKLTEKELLGFYELCQMSVSQFVDEMLKKDEDISKADIGVNLGKETFMVSGKDRYHLGKKILEIFGFDPEKTEDLQAFKDRFSKDDKKLWAVAKVLPLEEKAA